MDEDETWEIPMTRVLIELPESKAEQVLEIMKMYCSNLTKITQIE
jgi:hypothetical protein